MWYLIVSIPDLCTLTYLADYLPFFCFLNDNILMIFFVFNVKPTNQLTTEIRIKRVSQEV